MLRASSACGEGLTVKLQNDHLAAANIFMQKNNKKEFLNWGLDLVSAHLNRIDIFSCVQNC